MNLLQYTFFQHALLGSLLASIACGIIGTYIVTRRLVFISGGITHASFGGIGLGLFAGISPILSAAVFSVLSAFGVEWLSRRKDMREDSAIAVFWTLGMALGIMFSFLSPGFAPDLSAYLFGNILTINQTDLWMLGILALLLTGFFYLFIRPIVYIAFDREFARSQKIPVEIFEYLLMMFIALTIVACLRMVLFFFMMALQYGCIFISGFLKSTRGVYSFTTRYLEQMVRFDLDTMGRSVAYALIVSLAGTLFAMLFAYYMERRQIPGRNFLDCLVTLPYMLPGTCFGIGYILAFNSPPLKLTGTALIVISNMLFKQLPTATKICSATLTQVPRAQEKAVRDLGGGQLSVLKTVILPGLRPAFLSCFVYNFSSSMTTAGAILFLIDPGRRSCSKSKPVISGISTSKNNKSGCILVISFSPCLPFRAVPSKEKYGFFLSSMLNFPIATSSSSTITTLYLFISSVFSSGGYSHNIISSYYFIK